MQVLNVLTSRRPIQADQEKQIKKDEHIKAYKNPPEIVTALSLAARKKADVPLATMLILSVWSGLFLSIGAAAAVTVAGGLQYRTTKPGVNATVVDTPTQLTIPILPKLGLSAVFPIGLIFILLLGGELFTGNAMIMGLGLLTRRISILDLIVSWTVSFFGNYAGCVIAAVAFWGMGTLWEDPYHSFLSDLAIEKVNTNFGVNLLKAIPCNFLVCIAIALANASEDVSGKIAAGWWPIFTFVIAGFEHCVANQFFVTLAAFYQAPINYGTFIWQSLIPVTIGNIIGGTLFMAVVMWHAFHKPITTVTVPKNKQKKRKSDKESDIDVELGQLPNSSPNSDNNTST